MKRTRMSVAILVVAWGAADPALAYVGPGAGLSLLGALWGLLIAVGAVLGFVILWPLRRARRRARMKQANADMQVPAADGANAGKQGHPPERANESQDRRPGS